MVLVEHYHINGILMVSQKLIELRQSLLTQQQILQLLLVLHFQMTKIILFPLQRLTLELKLLQQVVEVVVMTLEAPVVVGNKVEVVNLL